MQAVQIGPVPAGERTQPPLDTVGAVLLEAACVPLEGGHASGTLERAEALLAAHPGIASGDIHAAAILGDEAATRRACGSCSNEAPIPIG